MSMERHLPPTLTGWLDRWTKATKESKELEEKLAEGYSWIEETYHGEYPAYEDRWVEEGGVGTVTDVVDDILTGVDIPIAKKKGLGALVVVGLIGVVLYSAYKGSK